MLLSITIAGFGCSDKSTGGNDDGVAPAQITDLSISGFTASSVTLA